jgi:hypothetical protein
MIDNSLNLTNEPDQNAHLVNNMQTWTLPPELEAELEAYWTSLGEASAAAIAAKKKQQVKRGSRRPSSLAAQRRPKTATPS